jgi:hypothetical protein
MLKDAPCVFAINAFCDIRIYSPKEPKLRFVLLVFPLPVGELFAEGEFFEFAD